jgi:hypothetical protein
MEEITNYLQNTPPNNKIFWNGPWTYSVRQCHAQTMESFTFEQTNPDSLKTAKERIKNWYIEKLNNDA